MGNADLVRGVKSNLSEQHFRLIVFDLDGTLIDSRRDIAESANAVLVACGARRSIARRRRMVGDGAATWSRACLRPQAAPPGALIGFSRSTTRLLIHTQPYEGIPGVLGELGTRGLLALLTNKPLAATRRILDGLDLARYLPADAVVGGDGTFPRKPDPAGLQHLSARVGVSAADTLLVGDSAIDWRTARNAGTMVCLARYGFGFEGFDVGQLREEDRVIDTPGELTRL